MRQSLALLELPFKTSFEPPSLCDLGQSSSRMLPPTAFGPDFYEIHLPHCTAMYLLACLSLRTVCSLQVQINSPSFTNHEILGVFFYLLKTVPYLQIEAINSFPASLINMKNWNKTVVMRVNTSTAAGPPETPIKGQFLPLASNYYNDSEGFFTSNWSTIGKRWERSQLSQCNGNKKGVEVKSGKMWWTFGLGLER